MLEMKLAVTSDRLGDNYPKHENVIGEINEADNRSGTNYMINFA